MTSPEPGEMEDVVATANIVAGLECWRDTAPLSEAEQAFITKILAHISRQEEEIKGLRDRERVRGTSDFAFMPADRFEALSASEPAFTSLRATAERAVTAGRPFVALCDKYPATWLPLKWIGDSLSSKDFRALSSALSELESQCSAVAESKRREDAPSSAPGSDGGGEL